jgi:hypothetical protein
VGEAEGEGRVAVDRKRVARKAVLEHVLATLPSAVLAARVRVVCVLLVRQRGSVGVSLVVYRAWAHMPRVVQLPARKAATMAA